MDYGYKLLVLALFDESMHDYQAFNLENMIICVVLVDEVVYELFPFVCLLFGGSGQGDIDVMAVGVRDVDVNVEIVQIMGQVVIFAVKICDWLGITKGVVFVDVALLEGFLYLRREQTLEHRSNY